MNRFRKFKVGVLGVQGPLFALEHCIWNQLGLLQHFLETPLILGMGSSAFDFRVFKLRKHVSLVPFFWCLNLLDELEQRAILLFDRFFNFEQQYQ